MTRRQYLNWCCLPLFNVGFGIFTNLNAHQQANRSMEFLPKVLADYVDSFVQDEPEVLQQLNRETHAKVLMPRMLSGHVQGRVLSLISKLMRPINILEIGTYTGYSAICLAEGLQPGGKLYTIDINEELEEMVRRYFDKAQIADRVDYRIGHALDIIPQLEATFDLVFIDADKVNYANYYDLVIDKVNPGGCILADNVLWSGKVVDEKRDKDTEALHQYNLKIKNDPRVEHLLLPIRDGIMIARKTV